MGGGYYIYCTAPPPSPLLAKNNIQCKCFKRLKKKFVSYLEGKKKHKVVDLNCLHLRKYRYCQVVLLKKTYFDFNDILIFNLQNSLKMNKVCLPIMFLMCTKFYKHTGEGFLRHSRIYSLFVSGLLHVQK